MFMQFLLACKAKYVKLLRMKKQKKKLLIPKKRWLYKTEEEILVRKAALRDKASNQSSFIDIDKW